MIFNGVKIEKLLGMPTTTQPNQFYLIEGADVPTQLYLSDSDGVLHLLNEGFIAGLNINQTVSITLDDTGLNNVYYSIGAAGTVTITLPEAIDGLEYSFAVLSETGLTISVPPDTDVYIGDQLVDSCAVISSTVKGSFLCLRAVGSTWIARYLTGQWNITASSGALLFNGDSLLFLGDTLVFTVCGVDGGEGGGESGPLLFLGDTLLFLGDGLTFTP